MDSFEGLTTEIKAVGEEIQKTSAQMEGELDGPLQAELTSKLVYLKSKEYKLLLNRLQLQNHGGTSSKGMSELSSQGLSDLTKKYGVLARKDITAPCATRGKVGTVAQDWLSRGESQQADATASNGRSSPGYLDNITRNCSLHSGWAFADCKRKYERGIFRLDSYETCDGHSQVCNPDVVLAMSIHVYDFGIRQSTRVVVDFKRDASEDNASKYLNQQTGELLAANLKSPAYSPISVCTDGMDFYRVMFLDGPQIYSWHVQPTEENSARAIFYGFIDDFMAGTLQPPTPDPASHVPFIADRKAWQPPLSESGVDDTDFEQDLSGFLSEGEVMQFELDMLVHALCDVD